MFTWRHLLWLAICIIFVICAVYSYIKKRPAFNTVLNSALIICAISEITKVLSTIEMVSSSDGSMIFPYIPTNHLPLHLCSIQILLIIFVRFTSNMKNKNVVLAFMYPTCLFGAVAALIMPSIFTTTIPIEKAFVSPISYQFFSFHAMLVALGIIIALSDEVKFTMKRFYSTVAMFFAIGFLSLYINSMLASPVYENGKLISVEFWPNFFFTYNNPLGITVTEKWQWILYLLIVSAIAILLTFIAYLPFIIRNRKTTDR